MSPSRVVVTTIDRPDVVEVSGLRGYPVACIADVLGKDHVAPPGLVGLTPGSPVCGPAITCQGPDVLIRRAAIDVAEPGDVLVVAAGGRTDRACFGSATAEHMRARGIAGIVVDGAVRDIADLRRLGFPTYAKGVTARNYDYPVALDEGAVNVAVNVDGCCVAPGDVIVADDDGVLIVPHAAVPGLATRVATAISAEHVKWARRLGGRFYAVEQLRERGYRVCASAQEVLG
ncbi:MAG: RraA family protein [Pseudonocardia sp.]